MDVGALTSIGSVAGLEEERYIAEPACSVLIVIQLGELKAYIVLLKASDQHAYRIASRPPARNRSGDLKKARNNSVISELCCFVMKLSGIRH